MANVNIIEDFPITTTTPRVHDVRISRSLDPKGHYQALVEWNPVVEKVPGILYFNVYRSETPIGTFRKLNTTTGITQAFYLDRYAERDISVNRFYKVTYITENGESDKEDATAVSVQGDVTIPGIQGSFLYILQEVNRRTDIFRDMVGEKVVIFLLKRVGINLKCPECWDPVGRRTTKDECPACNGTGVAGGGYDSYSTRLYIAPDSQEKQEETEVGYKVRNVLDCWIGNYPLINDNSFLVRQDDIRYLVTGVNWYRPQGFLVQQTFNATKLSPTHPIYKVPML